MMSEYRLLKTDKHRRYYFHLTNKDLGEFVTLEPREGPHRGETEPPGKRLCVSNTPAKCFVAFPIGYCESYYLYRSCRKITAKYPYGVPDKNLTGEKWILKPVRFKKIAFFEKDSEELNDIVKIHNQYVDCGSGDNIERAKDGRWLISRKHSVRKAYK